MTLLTAEYGKIIRKEKISRLISGFLIVANVAMLFGLVFMTPSYFLLILSKDDILRRLDAARENFEQKSFKTADDEIKSVNLLVSGYENDQSKRKAFAPILGKFASVSRPEIRASYLNLRKTDGLAFSLLIRGKATRREAFLDYLESLKSLPEAESVASPISNLLKDSDLDFSLEIKLKKETYGYVLEK